MAGSRRKSPLRGDPAMSTDLQERTVSTFADWLARRHSGFEALRERGRAVFSSRGIPTTKDEEWKYTSLRELTEATFHPSETRDGKDDAYRFASDAVRITLVNGVWIPSGAPLPSGLEVRRVENGDAQFGALANLEAHPFAALNTAVFESAVLIRIARNALIEAPIEIVHLTGSRAAAAPRLLVVAEEGSKATLIETYASIGEDAGFSNAVVEVFVAANAQLEHVKVQRENLNSFHIALTKARQERDSTYRHFSVTYGGRLTRNDLEVFLDGSNLHCRLDGIYVLDGEQIADNHTRLDHAYPQCDSFEVYKGVLDGRSRGVFNGKIYVHQDAQKTDAKQTNQAILLSPEATIDTKPQLEIYADDVKCTHGATVGQMREDALFYLRSRGIPGDQARALLVYAFAAEVLEKIECQPVRVALERLLFEKLA
ncbi:MAG TPA: Fe-S cluster assembly protein SufD [Fimbriimonadaceae bacterium]|nr:Fe-S cluster assembly protein SufD [Fimbriimonadaceae bacterium]HRJ96193.1 Fe-S cluster assembly protein SufD [Fimbriimonadaceae bacterium]